MISIDYNWRSRPDMVKSNQNRDRQGAALLKCFQHLMRKLALFGKFLISAEPRAQIDETLANLTHLYL